MAGYTKEAEGSKSLCSIFAIPAEPRLGSAPFLRVLFARSNLASTPPSSRSIPLRITPRRAPRLAVLHAANLLLAVLA